jgi:hypothetical protein
VRVRATVRKGENEVEVDVEDESDAISQHLIATAASDQHQHSANPSNTS